MGLIIYILGLLRTKHKAYYFRNGPIERNEYYVVYVEKEWFYWKEKEWWILLRRVDNHDCVFNWPKKKLKADPAKRDINYEIKRTRKVRA